MHSLKISLAEKKLVVMLAADGRYGLRCVCVCVCVCTVACTSIILFNVFNIRSLQQDVEMLCWIIPDKTF